MTHSPKSAQKQRLKRHQLAFDAIGTRWTIDISEPVNQFDEITRRLKSRIELFDKIYSRFRDDSLIHQMSKSAGVYELSPDGFKLITIYEQCYDLTNGLMTPLIGDTLEQAGYDATYSLKKGSMRSPPEWENVISYNESKITIKKPVTLDFGAAGKGYLVDIITELLETYKLHNVCVDAGGDMAYRSAANKSLDIGLEHPDYSDQIIGIVKLQSGQSICGSAGNRRAWADINHILNPQTLDSPHKIKALWTIADSTIVADAMSTALYFTDPIKAMKQFNFEYAIMHSDNSLTYSSDFPAEFYSSYT